MALHEDIVWAKRPPGPAAYYKSRIREPFTEVVLRPPENGQKYAMAELLGQAPEVLHNIFQHLDPTDFASLSKTCHFLYSFIKNDDLLWKGQYLALFVRLTQRAGSAPIKATTDQVWRHRIHRVIATQ
jgi:hypothetical protein